jgi:hypothetical protein
VVVAAWPAARAGVGASAPTGGTANGALAPSADMMAAAVKSMRSLMVSFPDDIFAGVCAPDELRQG